MALPTVAMPTATVHVGDTDVSVRGLTRGETMSMAGKIEDAVETEIKLLSHGLDTPLEDVRAWYHGTPSHVVQMLVTKVMELSGMDGLGNASSAA